MANIDERISANVKSRIKQTAGVFSLTPTQTELLQSVCNLAFSDGRRSAIEEHAPLNAAVFAAFNPTRKS